jgi:hypothetical protein
VKLPTDRRWRLQRIDWAHVGEWARALAGLAGLAVFVVYTVAILGAEAWHIIHYGAPFPLIGRGS